MTSPLPLINEPLFVEVLVLRLKRGFPPWARIPDNTPCTKVFRLPASTDGYRIEPRSALGVGFAQCVVEGNGILLRSARSPPPCVRGFANRYRREPDPLYSHVMASHQLGSPMMTKSRAGYASITYRAPREDVSSSMQPITEAVKTLDPMNAGAASTSTAKEPSTSTLLGRKASLPQRTLAGLPARYPGASPSALDTSAADGANRVPHIV